MRRALCLALGLVAGCSSSSDKAGDEACIEAAAQVSNALVGSQGCGPDAGCTVVVTPSCAASFGGAAASVAVANGSLAAVEHAFSVIEAETCAQCDATGKGPVSFEGVPPIAECNTSGSCALATVTPPSVSQGQGSFEWDCDAGCDAEAYCEVDVPGVWQWCQGWPGYGTVIGPGHCVSVTPTPPGTACYNTAFCGFEQNCSGDGGLLGVCEALCFLSSPSPLSSCVANCQLQPDNHLCTVCVCPTNGCPPADGGL